MKYRALRIIVSLLLFIAAFLLPSDVWWLPFSVFLAAYIIVGGDILFAAVLNIFRGNVFDENFLMALASAGAFAIGEYPEGVAVMLFYQVGEHFQSYAVDKSRKSIAKLMDIRPDYANVRLGAEVVRKDPEEVGVGDIILIKPGERIPLDGQVLEGISTVDTSALTGESLPRTVEPGSEILSGCINQTGMLVAAVIKPYAESTVSRILDLVENAAGKKSKSEQFITKFARYYTPIVVTLALLLAVLPPLVVPGAAFSDWIYRALSFLVVSCPCALVISVPLSFFGGIGGASRSGILIKGGNYLEALARAEIVAFDKTGTLTEGVFHLVEIRPEGINREELLELAALAESYSSHPIALSILRAYGREADRSRISEIREISGQGIRAIIDGRGVAVGNDKLMAEMGISCINGPEEGTYVQVAIDGRYAGYIRIADKIKADAMAAVAGLKAAGVAKTVMLTGDMDAVGRSVAERLGIDEVHTQLFPQEKMEKLEEVMTGLSRGGRLVYVGDGINDAPVLARADVGIAMGGLGSDAAIEAADVVIMTDEPSKIEAAIAISRHTLKIAKENIAFAISVKILILLLSALSITTMWAAIFADVGVLVLSILNAFRTLRVPKSRQKA